LFVRLPQDQAAALDRLVGSTGLRKQQLVSELLGESLAVGRLDIREAPQPLDDPVLTLEDVAALLRLPIEAACSWAAAHLPLFAINFVLATAEGLWASGHSW
jgi:hypothetical protein